MLALPPPPSLPAGWSGCVTSECRRSTWRGWSRPFPPFLLGASCPLRGLLLLSLAEGTAGPSPGPPWTGRPGSMRSHILSSIYITGHVLGSICRLFLIVVKYMCRKMYHLNHFKVYDSVAVSALALLCAGHGHRVSQLFFFTPKGNPVPTSSHAPLPPPPARHPGIYFVSYEFVSSGYFI